MLTLAATMASGQKYSITFKIAEAKDSVAYIGQHFRDQYIIRDTARLANGCYTFEGKRNWPRGIYALVDASRKKGIADFVIDGSQQFTVAMDAAHRATSVKGSDANKSMFAYINTINDAKAEQKKLNQQLSTADSLKARKGLQALNKKMDLYESNSFAKHKGELFFDLVRMFDGPEVPAEAADKGYYYRQHYWDGIDLSDHSLIFTPNLFNKVNLYFFGLLYNSDTDTITHYADRLLQTIEHDSTMMNYVLEYIMPKYYRSTKNIGWDAAWCYLVRKYYLTGKCPWATAGDLYNKQKTCEFLEKSLIGAHGAELWMADTNQSPNPRDWKSSHRQPYPYVILWFWDPDCNHCQEQTDELIELYNSLTAAGTRNFEVYAVGYESDVEKWKRYVREHHLPFVNVGGPNVNVDYQEAYNVHGAPTMIILNKKRDIIMNKTLPTESIIPFLEDYEKKHK